MILLHYLNVNRPHSLQQVALAPILSPEFNLNIIHTVPEALLYYFVKVQVEFTFLSDTFLPNEKMICSYSSL